MRVIAGEFRSRPLKAPAGWATRPTSDRLRETLFNVLQGRVRGARFADLYAGTGAVGIEAISRGAAWVDFAEKEPGALAAMRGNLQTLGIRAGFAVEDRGVDRLLAERLRRAAGGGAGSGAGSGLAGIGQPRSWDVVFLDPPYEDAAAYANTLQALGEHADALLAAGALVIAEHRRRGELGEQWGVLHRVRLLEQGDAALSFFEIRSAVKA